MAHVSYTAITDGASRAAGSVNDIQNSFVTQSTNIDGTNFKDEGLDHRAITQGAIVDQTTQYVEYEGAGAAVNTGGAWQTLVLGAQTFSIAGNWSVGNGVGMVRIRFRTWWGYAFPGPPGSSLISPTIQFRLAYVMDGGAVTAIPKSTRAFNGRESVTSTAAAQWVGTYRDGFKYAFLVPLPDTSAHTLDSIRVQVNTPGANWTIHKSTLTAMRFLKAV